MSKFVKVRTQLRDLNLIKQSLDDLKLAYSENANYAHVWSGFRGTVPLVVKVNHVQFGVRPTPSGEFEVIGDDMHMKFINQKLGELQQRYAYHAVRQATTGAGFDLIEETTGRDGVIRMTVRRWS
jgi:hypothetical protein